LKPGQEAVVQVVKEAIGTKGPKVTTHLTLPGKYFVLTPTKEYTGVSLKIEEEAERERLRNISEKLTGKKSGVIIRTDAVNKSKKDLTRDLKKLNAAWQEIEKASREKGKVPRCIYREKDITFKSIRDMLSQDVDKLVINHATTYEEIKNYLKEIVPEYIAKLELDEDIDIFEKYGIEPYIKKAAANRVWLKCGGYIVIDKTEALTVIDVNTGKYTGGSSLEETVTTANCEAAREIAKQLRLRDISGIIIIDFIDM
jgi:ribonuclease G